MELAFAYAQNQFIGMVFEPFMLTADRRYVYSGAFGWLLRILPAWVARRLFVHLVEVS